MHAVIPFAGASSLASAEAASSLALPRLERLLALLTASSRDEGDAYSLSPPHERALARAWGWPVVDGLIPMASLAAAADGLQITDPAQGIAQITPCHWLASAEHISLTNPQELALQEAESRTLFEALAPLCHDDGIALHWANPQRWYMAHPALQTLPTASLDRVMGRNVDHWLNSHAEARRFRRLQAEAQMLWHSHAVNAAREDRGALPVNSFWMSGTGQPLALPAIGGHTVLDSLRAPALAEDWAAWAEAWAALDAEVLPPWVEAAEQGQAVQLTLCGEQHAHTFELRPRGWRQRWLGPRRVAAAPILQGL